MDYSILKDEELVLMCRQNDEEAFSCLTLRYISTAKVIAARYGDSSIENADLVQEAMFAFISAVYSYDSEKACSFSTYAGVCMKNRILSLLRSLSSKKRVPQTMLVSLEDNSGLPVAPSPEESFLVDSSAEYIYSLISSDLSSREQQVFGLFLTGLSYEEIARELDSTVKSVDSTLQRARKKLRERLSSYK